MRVVNFVADNFKRLKVVDITPEGAVVTVGGKNGQGKSSVLDAIYVALKGRSVAPPQPVRKGEDKCVIRLDLGEIVCTRTFTVKDGGKFTDTLKLERPNGDRVSNPQEVLDNLLGEIGFDPFAFVQMKPKDQTATLLGMVPLSIDLDELAEADESDMARRRDVNRDGKALAAQVEAIPKFQIPDDVPDREVLVSALGGAADKNTAIEREIARRSGMEREFDTRARTAAQDRARAAEMQEEADRLAKAAADKIADAVAMDARAAEARDEINALPPLDEPVNTDAIRQQLRDAEDLHAKIARERSLVELEAKLTAMRAESQGYTDAMAKRAKERADALAKAKMPIDGLAFVIGEDGKASVQFNGVPFEQASTAEQLRASTAIAMAANPTLRVLRIKDGSLLDEDSMAQLAAMAAEEDYQLWIEVVGGGDGVGIIMEDGEIKAAPEKVETVEERPEGDDSPKESTKRPRKGDAPQGGLL